MAENQEFVRCLSQVFNRGYKQGIALEQPMCYKQVLISINEGNLGGLVKFVNRLALNLQLSLSFSEVFV